jgi:hypothetical protein
MSLLLFVNGSNQTETIEVEKDFHRCVRDALVAIQDGWFSASE